MIFLCFVLFLFHIPLLRNGEHLPLPEISHQFHKKCCKFPLCRIFSNSLDLEYTNVHFPCVYTVREESQSYLFSFQLFNIPITSSSCIRTTRVEIVCHYVTVFYMHSFHFFKLLQHNILVYQRYVLRRISYFIYITNSKKFLFIMVFSTIHTKDEM